MTSSPQVRTQRDELRVLEYPAPIVDPVRLIRNGDEDAFLLSTPQSTSGIAALGVTFRLSATDEDDKSRFSTIQSAAERVTELLPKYAPSPLFVGGFSFLPGAANETPWNTFGDAHFVVPRWTYRVEGRHATLRFFSANSNENIDAIRKERDRLLLRLSRGEPQDEMLGEPMVRHENESRHNYESRIDSLLSAIRDGRFEKVVAARRVELRGQMPPLCTILKRLADAHPASRSYLVSSKESRFIGATPERLVRLEDGEIETDSLAGTALGDGHDLWKSSKNMAEHHLVTQMLQDTLSAYASMRAEETRIRRFGKIAHLHTPLRGTVEKPTHILQLVEALHPTPAVGGLPRTKALEWIADNEAPRGLYAAPVGYFDSSGEGEFHVALRGGLIQKERATLYAGGGIVEGSTASAEWDEAELKLQSIVSALSPYH